MLGENWYELALRVEGQIVEHFVEYFFLHYFPTGASPPSLNLEHPTTFTRVSFQEKFPTLIHELNSPELPIVFLSQASSRLGALPFAPVKSATALFRIEVINRAQRTIFIQSPNLTSRSLVKALKRALLRSVEVTLFLPRNMMVLESIVTGWTTTAWTVWRLKRWARKLREVHLNVKSFKCDQGQPFVVEMNRSHIKFMVVDEESVILGSSNLDRASVMTSGEADIAFSDAGLAKALLTAVRDHQSTDRDAGDISV